MWWNCIFRMILAFEINVVRCLSLFVSSITFIHNNVIVIVPVLNATQTIHSQRINWIHFNNNVHKYKTFSYPIQFQTKSILYNTIQNILYRFFVDFSFFFFWNLWLTLSLHIYICNISFIYSFRFVNALARYFSTFEFVFLWFL